MQHEKWEVNTQKLKYSNIVQWKASEQTHTENNFIVVEWMIGLMMAFGVLLFDSMLNSSSDTYRLIYRIRNPTRYIEMQMAVKSALCLSLKLLVSPSQFNSKSNNSFFLFLLFDVQKRQKDEEFLPHSFPHSFCCFSVCVISFLFILMLSTSLRF